MQSHSRDQIRGVIVGTVETKSTGAGVIVGTELEAGGMVISVETESMVQDS